MKKKKKVFISQKEYLRYLRWRRCVIHIIAVCSVVLLFVFIVAVNPHSIGAWMLFAVYLLFIVILSYRAEQEYRKQDKDAANKIAQEKLVAENKKRINRRQWLS